MVSTVLLTNCSYAQAFLIGHQQAWERAGILHRDVSIGNILIVDKPREGSFMGFIHDFDYSSVEEEDESVPHLVDDMPLDDADDEAHETAVVQKERTVSLLVAF